MEDGTAGDLSIRDILLFRILVRKQAGATSKPINGRRRQRPRASSISSAVRDMVAEDVQAEEEYERLLEVWSAWSSERINGGTDDDQETNLKSCVAVKFVFQVTTGRLCFFSPLQATVDEAPLRRLQERFLEFTYTDFKVGLSLMGDYETLSFDMSLADFDAMEVRSNRTISTFVSRHESHQQQTGDVVFHDASRTQQQHDKQKPLLVLELTKHPPGVGDYDFALQARVSKVEVSLEREAEWLERLRGLIQPLPQLKKVMCGL